MKRMIYSVCIGSLALAVAAWGEEPDGHQNQKGSHKKQAVQHASARSTNKMTNHASQARNQRTYQGTPRTHSGSMARQSNPMNDRTHTSHARNLSSSNQIQARPNREINHQVNSNANHVRTVNTNGERNLTVNQHRNVTVSNNWQGQRFSGQQYDAFRNYRRESHNSNWWRSHNDRIIFVGGGWYSWDVAGFWFPALGYARGYNYPYYGPIYGYNNLSPDQVVINVQAQLQRGGYYSGPTDGVLGPMTRQAIGSYQADHGLAVTSAVDEPTLAELGLV